MKETEKVCDFSTRVAEIVNQIKSYGDTIQEKKIIEKVLRSLPQKFVYVVVVLEESKDFSTYTMYELINSLEAHEKRVGRFSNQPVEQALQSKLNFIEKKDVEKRRHNLNQSHRRGGGTSK